MATKTRNLRFELDQIMNPTGEREGYGSIQNKFTNESTKAGAFTTDILSMVQDIGRKDEDKPTGFIAPTSYRSTRTSMDIARTMQKRAEEEAQFSGAMLGSGVGRTQQKTPFVKAVANSLVASMFNIARQTLSNDPSITTPAQAEDQKRFEQTVTKIIESTMPKEDRAVKPVWEGAFQRQAERVSRTPELTKRLAGTAERIRETPESTRQFLRTQEDLARQRADLENAAYVTRLMSGVAESIPLSLATRIPVLGWALMANTTFKNSLEQSVQANPNAQADDYNMMLIKAIGDAALEIGTEMIFPLYGASASTAKGIAKGAIKPSLMDATKGFVSFFKKTGGEIIEPTIKNISKQVLRQAGEEAVEEGLNYFLGAYLAVLTTDKGKNVWSRQYGDDPEAIVSIAGLLDAMLTGAISGGLTTAGRFAIPAAKYASINGLFTNTREAVAKVENKTIDNITPTESKAVYDAIVKDMANEDNSSFVLESNLDAVSKTEQQASVMPQNIDQIISQLEASPDMTLGETGELIPTQGIVPSATMPVEATTRPSERVQEPEVSVPSEEPAIAPEAPSEVQRPQQAPAEDGKISLDNAEVISDKSSTGKVYRIGDKVYKSALFIGLPGRRIPNGRPTIEAQVYEELKNSDAIGRGRSVEIDGKPYIELPYYEMVISTDEIQTADREMYQPIIEENIDRIIQSVQDLSNAGYDYGDPLQFGYDGDKMYLIDFSNTLKGEPNEVLNDNYNRLSNFFKEFGFERMGYIVSRGMQLRRNLESLVYEDVDKEDYNMLLKFTPEEIRGTVDELKQSSGDMPPNNVYYATNGRGIQIGNIMQTDRINGVKHIFSEKPLDPKVVADWEMKPIYVGSVPSTNPEVKEQKKARLQSKAKANAHPVAKPVKKESPKAKKKRQYYSLLMIDGKPTASPVIGNKVTLESMPETEFFIRKTDKGKKGSWSVIEASSGLAISAGQLTRKVAIEIANNNINRYGKDAILEKVKSSVDKFGSMPVEFVEEVKDVQQQPEKPKAPPKITYMHGKTAADFVEKKTEPAKVVEQKAEQAPKLTVSRKDLDRMYDEGTRGKQLENAVDEWLDSDDVQAQEIRNIKTEADVADAVLRVREEIRTGLEVGTDGMIKGKFLQLLALSRWALRLESVPKGSSVTDHMAKLVDVLREGQPKDIQRQIESAVTDDMLFHRIIGDATVIGTAQEAMDRGNEIQKLNHRKNLEARFTTVNDSDLEPSLVLQMDMYATELLKEGKIEESIRIGNLVSQRLSKVARYLRAARHLKNLSPIRRAEKIIKDFDSEVDPVAKENVEDATKETVESVIKNRKEKILEGSKEVDKEIEKRIIDDEKKSDETGRKSAERDSIDDVATQVDSVIDAEGEATEEQTNKLAEKIKRYAKQKTEPKKAPTFEERMVRRLMTKFIEKNPDKRQKLIDDPYAVITEIVSNRSEYADLWKDAQSILQKDAKAKEYEDVISFLKMLADPVQADKFMLNAIRKNLKENNTTMRKLARTYTDNPDGTIDGFFADLKKKLVGLDDAGFNYLKKYMQPLLESTLKRNFQAQQDAIAKLKEERAKEKKALTPEEIIAARIRSSIKTANRETQPKVYTAEQLLIKALMQKHKDNMQRQGKKVPDRMSLFNMLGQIVANRQQYEAVWFAARSLLQKYPDLQFSDVYKVLKNFNNPIVAQTYINHAISQTIKSMKMTVQGVAKDYFFKGDETFKNFYKSLTGMMPEMDQYAERYFIDLVKPVFDAKMKEARALSHKRLKEQVERRQKRRSDKRSQDQIVEQLQNAVFRDELNIDALRDIWANRMGLPYITSTMRQDIYDSVLAMSKAKNQDEADEIYQKMVMRISSELPSDMVDKILAVTRFMMLMNPVTLIRNMTSNMAVMPVYNTADRLQGFIEKVLGVPKEDRITGSRWIDSKEAGFIGDTVREYTDGDKLKKHLLRSSKYDIRTLVGIERKIFNSSRLDNFMKSPHRLMNEGQIGKIRIKPIGDQFAYSKHFKRAMANRLAAKGFSQSMTNEQQQSIINEAMQYAEEVAAIRTFRQITGIAEKLLSLGKPRYSNKQIAESTPFSAMGKQAINTGTKLAARIAFPFIVTPTALVYESYKLSPIAMLTAFAQYGLAKGFYKKRGQALPSEVKVKFARQMAQSITGSVMAYTLGAILASLGYVDMEEPESEKERAALGLAGGRKYSLRIPGVGSFSIDWLQPLSTPFLMGASLARAIENSHGGDWAINSLSTGFEVFVDTTMLNNIFNFGGSAYMTPAEKALGFAFTGANQFTSSSIRRLNRVIDPYQRDIYSGTAVQDMFRSFVAGVPFGTFLLPIKYDVWGRPSNFADTSKAQGVLERSLLNFIAPFIRTREDQDALTKEVLRLHEAVKKDFGNDMLPSVAPKSVDGYRLAGDEYSWYAKRLGELQYNYASNAIRSPSYRSAQASGKVKILKDAYARARKQAKEDLMKQDFFNPEILP